MLFVGDRLLNGGAVVGQQASQQRCCRWPTTFSLAAALPLKQMYPEGTVISFLPQPLEGVSSRRLIAAFDHMSVSFHHI